MFEFLHPLYIVLIFSTNRRTKKTTHTILFSTDLKQEYDKIIDYYSLRFQIEFNFRDAKQFFGLEDFMHPKSISSLRSRQHQKKTTTQLC